MIQRSFVIRSLFAFSFLVCLPSAQAGYLNITFQGSVTGSFDEYGNLFDAGVGGNTILGESVTGSFLVDLALAEYRGTDYEVGGDVYYSTGSGPGRYITSQIDIGGRNFVLGHSTGSSASDEESVWMFRAAVPDYDGPRDFLAISDEYEYEGDEESGISSFNLSLSIIDQLDIFLSSLDLDQEFSWVDNSDLPGTNSGGRLLVEADIGIGLAFFNVNAVQASLVSTEVPEPATIGILLTGMLVALGLLRRSARRVSKHKNPGRF